MDVADGRPGPSCAPMASGPRCSCRKARAPREGEGLSFSGLCLRHPVGPRPRGREGGDLRVESGPSTRGPSRFAFPSRRTLACAPARRGCRADVRQAGLPYECRSGFPLERRSWVGLVLCPATLRHPGCGPRANGSGVGCGWSFNALVSGALTGSERRRVVLPPGHSAEAKAFAPGASRISKADSSRSNLNW